MTIAPPPNRPQMALDLTRWNRAGLERFEYVDGDAAVWLEELRIAMLAVFLRDSDAAKDEMRTPEYWRDLLLEETDQWPDSAELKAVVEALDWQRVLTDLPADPETAGKRNRRLLEQYGLRTSDYTWEMLRAFARASHVLLGHLDAYANEGYLRTATQWDNVRRLAAMVNYQPTPPASATATVALLLDEGADLAGETVVIDRGLAMKYAPPEGGAPLVFETLEEVEAHPDLNAARVSGWDYDATTLDFSSATLWIAPEKATLAPGDLIVVAPVVGNPPAGQPVSIVNVSRDVEAEVAHLDFEPKPTGAWETGNARLLTEPTDVRVGLPRTELGTGKDLIVEVQSASRYKVDSVVEVKASSGTFLATVTGTEGGFLHLDTAQRPTGALTVEEFTPFELAPEPEGDFVFETPAATEWLYFKRAGSSGSPVIDRKFDDSRKEGSKIIAHQYRKPSGAEGLGYGRAPADHRRQDAGRVVDLYPEVIPGGGGQPSKTVRFAGEPPKGLTVGDWFAARPILGGTAEALQVRGVRTAADVYFIEFDKAPPADADETEFFGPMTRELRPVDWDRGQAAPVVGGVAELEDLAEEARRLIKTGLTVLVAEDEDVAGERRAVSATISAVQEVGAGDLEITLDTEESFAGWKSGWTSFHLNVVDVSHGETKGSKVLGSGDGERARQTFQFGVKGVSFVPSTASSTGVVPDMDVSVDGELWQVRDDGDPTAEETRSYSVVLNEDDTLEIRFRRRLASGNNNVLVSRHRLGVGSTATGVPSWSFVKPMKKHRFVTGVVQPFATAGGADREPVSDMRTNAPAKLAANDRAVSLADFERLCRRHASVWQARARQVVGPGPRQLVAITVVPAEGDPTTEKLRQDLAAYVETRAIPGVRVTIEDYEAVPVTLAATVHVDTERFDRDDVRDAAEDALVAAFGLKQRALGQPFYRAEILAALERVEGVSSAIVDDFAARPSAPASLGEAQAGGVLATIFPKGDQVVVVDLPSDVAVIVEAVT